jgi:hypothetical protein
MERPGLSPNRLWGDTVGTVAMTTNQRPYATINSTSALRLLISQMHQLTELFYTLVSSKS